MDKLQICVVEVLEKCEESTPANLVESMFKFVRNETPCVNLTEVSNVQKNIGDERGKGRSPPPIPPSSNDGLDITLNVCFFL